MSRKGTRNADGTITIDGKTYKVRKIGEPIKYTTSDAMGERIEQIEHDFENYRGVPNYMRTELLTLKREMPILRTKEKMESLGWSVVK